MAMTVQTIFQQLNSIDNNNDKTKAIDIAHNAIDIAHLLAKAATKTETEEPSTNKNELPTIVETHQGTTPDQSTETTSTKSSASDAESTATEETVEVEPTEEDKPTDESKTKEDNNQNNPSSTTEQSQETNNFWDNT